MLLRLCQNSWYHWRTHRGPYASHPYLKELPKSQKPRDPNGAKKALSLLWGLASMGRF